MAVTFINIIAWIAIIALLVISGLIIIFSEPTKKGGVEGTNWTGWGSALGGLVAIALVVWLGIYILTIEEPHDAIWFEINDVNDQGISYSRCTNVKPSTPVASYPSLDACIKGSKKYSGFRCRNGVCNSDLGNLSEPRFYISRNKCGQDCFHDGSFIKDGKCVWRENSCMLDEATGEGTIRADLSDGGSRCWPIQDGCKVIGYRAGDCRLTVCTTGEIKSGVCTSIPESCCPTCTTDDCRENCGEGVLCPGCSETCRLGVTGCLPKRQCSLAECTGSDGFVAGECVLTKCIPANPDCYGTKDLCCTTCGDIPDESVACNMECDRGYNKQVSGDEIICRRCSLQEYGDDWEKCSPNPLGCSQFLEEHISPQ
jgi:hypothetical protein